MNKQLLLSCIYQWVQILYNAYNLVFQKYHVIFSIETDNQSYIKYTAVYLLTY